MDACVWCGRDSGCVGLPACPRGAGKPRTGVAVFEPRRERLWLALSGLGDGLCPCAAAVAPCAPRVGSARAGCPPYIRRR